MRCLAVLGALWFLAASTSAWAQIEVSAQTSRSNFLLYERMDLLVTIQNIGGNDLVLDNAEGHPWLSFLVSTRDEHNQFPVRPERTSMFAALTLKSGETKTLRVNLTPLFAFREEGGYEAEAVVDLPGEGQIISQKVPFSVMKGRKVWSQIRPVDSSERIYSLIRFSPDADSTNLYLRVENPSENIVYTNLALGTLAADVDPAVNFDPQGNVHVLQSIAMSSYLYTRADPDGKILDQTLFKTYHEIPPRLNKLEDGNVTVVGGMAEDPTMPLERLSDPQGARRALPVTLPVSTGTP